MDPFLGQITMFGGNFAPRGWALCDGQLLSISQYSALFSLLGTTYGGDGRTTFGLPDLRSRVPMHAGHGPGLSNRPLGQKGGSETNRLSVAQLPAHHHTLNAKEEANSDDPSNNFVAGTGTNAFGTAADVAMNPNSTGDTGGGQEVNNIQPYQCINYIIALQGVYPSRN